ncbi:YqeG family HAD IIIA-type phosphatase [Clostridium boliviensis]|uniref:YqeG family HAD IIIA-type phosphatase n=1 Tax=Clostridium boliviensis TaxID=318465 RepID=A0ABU4GN27_9CLOT|nr:YqeG family HAD IIIA-type phosphatase [Clostridium boliviensis]MDW2798998.1 YqeG family HAD IIIA-type phosphatase [Clostridium boliviensis]
MLQRFYPDEDVNSTYEIPFEEFYKKGIRGVIFDVDNTLVPHGAPADNRAKKLFSTLHQMGMETCLLSNNKEPRVAAFARDAGSLKYIYKGRKPGIRGYQQAMRLMGTDISNTIFVGDQLFTDVFGAKRAGIHSIFVKRIHPKEEIQIRMKRALESVVLHYYHKNKKIRHGKRR